MVYSCPAELARRAALVIAGSKESSIGKIHRLSDGATTIMLKFLITCCEIQRNSKARGKRRIDLFRK
jgi:hypothetical protein